MCAVVTAFVGHSRVTIIELWQVIAELKQTYELFETSYEPVVQYVSSLGQVFENYAPFPYEQLSAG